jgi:rhodanese-related sulfurtransferase
MDCNTLKQKLKENANLQLIDIREPFEHEDGYISKVNIPLAEVMNRINEFDTNQEIIIYCNSGKRSKALKYMIAKTYSVEKIDHLEGGYQAWTESN